jgi:hypothetical protein
MKLGTDHHTPLCVCTNCGQKIDGATGLTDGNAPESGDCTICIYCGHIMIFADDLTLRDPTEDEIIRLAGDKQIIAVQRVRANIERERADLEDFIRDTAKKNDVWLTHERVNKLVDASLKRMMQAVRQAG